MIEPSSRAIIRRIDHFIAIKPGILLIVDGEHHLELTSDAIDAPALDEEALLARRMRDGRTGRPTE